jgi:hypothetical protein
MAPLGVGSRISSKEGIAQSGTLATVDEEQGRKMEAKGCEMPFPPAVPGFPAFMLHATMWKVYQLSRGCQRKNAEK